MHEENLGQQALDKCQAVLNKMRDDDRLLREEARASESGEPRFSYFVSIPSERRLYKYSFSHGDLYVNEEVLVPFQGGLKVARVNSGALSSNLEQAQKLQKIIRRASHKDLDVEQRIREREQRATEYCRMRIEESKLQMKLIRVSANQKEGKISFYFTAEKRVDFRSLVRELASELKARVQMTQVGVRDETRLVGAYGPCGRECCCSSYLQKFSTVSIKMAKDQGLSLNPQKLSGICGRLKCCLVYEHAVYNEAARKLPRQGNKVRFRTGDFTVAAVNPLRPSLLLRGPEGELVIEGEDLKVVQVLDSRGQPKEDEHRMAAELKALEDEGGGAAS